jgi:voltage-gated potassium channel
MTKKLPVFFDKFIYLLIIFNLISMVVESEPDLSIEVKNYLSNFEIFSIAIFSIEYIIRSLVAIKTKKRYNFSFFGIIDIISILPFFFGKIIGFDGRFVRVFRLFRISRILKLGKFSKSFELLGQ